VPCHVPGLGESVLCGSVERPLDAKAPTGRWISVNFAVVPAKARARHADPVYFLAGGPGQSAIAILPIVLPNLRRLNNRRDLVFVDQRGTGTSAALRCPPERALADTLDPATLPARMQLCRRALERLPQGDLRQFTTAIAMADLDAVREQLGHEQINLIGGSYGTRAALDYLRLHPQRVRRVVLDGVVPPDVALSHMLAADAASALAALFADCEADGECARRHPRLRAHWESLFADLPRSLVLANPLTGRKESVTLSEGAITALVRPPLYSPALAAALPQAIDDAAAGDWNGLVGLASAVAGRPGLGIDLGMHFAVVCAEDAGIAGEGGTTGRFSHGLADAYAEVCRDWPTGEVDAEFRRLSPSPVPVLLLSGGLDPATPPRHAERVAAALGTKTRHIVVAHAGHGIMAIGCAGDLVFQFVDAVDEQQALAIDAACLADIPRPPAFVPSRIRQEARQ